MRVINDIQINLPEAKWTSLAALRETAHEEGFAYLRDDLRDHILEKCRRAELIVGRDNMSGVTFVLWADDHTPGDFKQRQTIGLDMDTEHGDDLEFAFALVEFAKGRCDLRDPDLEPFLEDDMSSEDGGHAIDRLGSPE